MRRSWKAIVDRSKSLRRAMTLPEVLLWRALRARPGGHKFRHQHALGGYVLDFYCPASALCIEVDGKGHEMGANPKRDARRDAWLAERGIETIRIPASDVLAGIEPVVMLIEEKCASRRPYQSSPRNRGEGDHAKHGGGAARGQERPSTALHAVPLPAKSRGGFK